MVSVGDFVEHVVCVVEFAAFAIHVDEGVGDGDGGGRGGSVTEFEDVGVDLFSDVKVLDAGGCF